MPAARRLRTRRWIGPIILVGLLLGGLGIGSFPAQGQPTWGEPVRTARFAPDATASFGSSLAIDDGTMVVGEPANDTVHVYVKMQGLGLPGGWIPQATLHAPEDLAGSWSGCSTEFGAAVDVDGDTLVVGAPCGQDSFSVGEGTTFVFEREGGSWRPDQEIRDRSGSEDQDGVREETFGASVALDGETLVVGDPRADYTRNDDNDQLTGDDEDDPGAAYIYHGDEVGWKRTAVLGRSDPFPWRHLGQAVAVDAGIVAVGIPGHGHGAIRVYEAVGTWGAHVNDLPPVSPWPSKWHPVAYFDQDELGIEPDLEPRLGTSVAVDHLVLDRTPAPRSWHPPRSHTVVVAGTPGTGQAFAFLRTGTERGLGWNTDAWAWSELEPSYRAGPLFWTRSRPPKGFGTSVAIDGDRILVGGEASPAIVFRMQPDKAELLSWCDRSGTRLGYNEDVDCMRSLWEEHVRIRAADEPNFGRTVGLDDGIAAVGAPGYDRPSASTYYLPTPRHNATVNGIRAAEDAAWALGNATGLWGEPDLFEEDFYGDIWEEQVCRKYGLGSVRNGTCDLTRELVELAAPCDTKEPTDLDCDGLDLHEEFCWGTDPVDEDTDDDGWIDGPEAVHWHRRYDNGERDCTEVGGPDQADARRHKEATVYSDGDGTPDIVDADSDDDGLLDGVEHGRDYPQGRDDTEATRPAANPHNPYDGNASTDPARNDTDDDGLTDWEELCRRGETSGDGSCPRDGWGTDPNDPDTDDDGAEDGLEAAHWGETRFDDNIDGDGIRNNLLDPDSDVDSWPGTGNARDGAELDAGLDPGAWDTDGDGMPDGYEIRFNLAATVEDAGADADGDGLTNRKEYRGFESSKDNVTTRRPGGYDETTEGPWTEGFRPDKADMDGDGLTDGQEVHGTLNPFDHRAHYDDFPGSTDARDRDTEDDGRSDLEEGTAQPPTDPNRAGSAPDEICRHLSGGDADRDGLKNQEECDWTIQVRRMAETNATTVTVFSDPQDPDTDDDGLDDAREHELGSDPGRPDTDGDGLDDLTESGTGCSLAAADSDGDELSDQDERHAPRTNCRRADTDGDGLTDWIEFHGWRVTEEGCDGNFCSGEFSADPRDPDTDDDGLDDGSEFRSKTNPREPDSDRDGLDDGDEIHRENGSRSNPRRIDTDGDGLEDGEDPAPSDPENAQHDQDEDALIDTEEQDLGTDPSAKDTDGDLLNDYAEVRVWGSHPNASDSDNDTLPDLVDPRPLIEDLPPVLKELRSHKRNWSRGIAFQAYDSSAARTSLDVTVQGIDGSGDCEAGDVDPKIESVQIDRYGTQFWATFEDPVPVDSCDIQIVLVDSHGNALVTTIALKAQGEGVLISRVRMIGTWAKKHPTATTLGTPGVCAAGGVVVAGGTGPAAPITGPGFYEGCTMVVGGGLDFSENVASTCSWTGGAKLTLVDTPTWLLKAVPTGGLDPVLKLSAEVIDSPTVVSSLKRGAIRMGLVDVKCGDVLRESVEMESTPSVRAIEDKEGRVVVLHKPGFHEKVEDPHCPGDTCVRGGGLKRVEEEAGLEEPEVLDVIERGTSWMEGSLRIYCAGPMQGEYVHVKALDGVVVTASQGPAQGAAPC